jgi:hypothetical protein
MPEPIFKTVLGDQWTQLGSIVRRHYSLTPFSQDYVRVDGVMEEIHHSLIAKLLIPFGLLFGAIVPFRAENVPVSVHYSSSPNDANLYWDRAFRLRNQKDFHFKSYMHHISDNEVIEYVRFGIGMRLRVTAEDGALVFRDEGYVWRLFGHTVPVPVGLLFGSAYVEERPIDADSFSMKMELVHPLFGTLFRYQGHFAIANSSEQLP